MAMDGEYMRMLQLFENNLPEYYNERLESIGYSIPSLLQTSKDIIDSAADNKNVPLKDIFENETFNARLVGLSINPGDEFKLYFGIEPKLYSGIDEVNLGFCYNDKFGPIEIIVYPILGKAVYGGTVYSVPDVKF